MTYLEFHWLGKSDYLFSSARTHSARRKLRFIGHYIRRKNSPINISSINHSQDVEKSQQGRPKLPEILESLSYNPENIR